MWRAILLGVACACWVPGLALAQGGEGDSDPSAEARRDRHAARRAHRGPNRPPLTLHRDPELGLSPAYTFVGLGVTAALGGVMVWSLVDTLAASDRYHVDPTREGYEDGRRRVRRTWLLGAASSVTAIATLLVAVLGTDWGGDPERVVLRPELGLRAGGLSLSGSF